MPEIAEVARIVHHIRQRIVGRTLKNVIARDDANVFGKAGTSAADFQEAMTGKKVTDAGQQGKYFWMIMSDPPHPLFHFGMSGWIFIRDDPSIHYKAKSLGDEWPPKYWKFTLETDGEPKVEAAFSDARRFGRIRLLDCDKENIRNTTPLKENGPDPVIDKDNLSVDWLREKLSHRHVPIKVFLLDQSNISGIGNWVGDEILYHSKIHPEQYSNTLSNDQVIRLYKSIMHICQTAVAALADSEIFPKDWLFNFRWGKGKKNAMTCLPCGEKISFVIVGGRTSCFVPSVQKKQMKKPTDGITQDHITENCENNNNSHKSKKNAVKSRIDENQSIYTNFNRMVLRKRGLTNSSESTKGAQVSQSYEITGNILGNSTKRDGMIVERASHKKSKAPAI